MQGRLYVVKEEALPQVLLDVLKVKELLESGQSKSIYEAIEEVGISKSTFYKYKDMINTYEDHERMQVTLNDLSKILSGIARDGIDIIVKETDG